MSGHILSRAKDPIIFRPLKSLTLKNPQQESLLRLAQEGISVSLANLWTKFVLFDVWTVPRSTVPTLQSMLRQEV